jgi:hypothetical protein
MTENDAPPIDAILKLVRYLECDERKHFEGMWLAGEDTSDHIFNYVRAVSDWLEGQPGIPSAEERERERTAPVDEAFAAAGVQILKGDFADFWNRDKQRGH